MGALLGGAGEIVLLSHLLFAKRNLAVSTVFSLAEHVALASILIGKMLTSTGLVAAESSIDVLLLQTSQLFLVLLSKTQRSHA